MFEPTPSQLWAQQNQDSRRDRNIPSALLSLVFIVIMSTALAQPQWYYLKGGGCSRKFIGVQEFFFLNDMESVPATPYEKKEMKACFTQEIINLHRAIIVFCFISIFCALTQFFMDVIGVGCSWLKTVRRNSVSMIMSVVLTIAIIGLCYYSSEMMKAQQEKSKLIATTSIEIDFAVSYYLIIGAGVVGVLGVGSNLLRRYPEDHVDDAEILLDDCQGETFSVALPHSHTWDNFRHLGMPEIPPPPPYSP